MVKVVHIKRVNIGTFHIFILLLLFYFLLHVRPPQKSLHHISHHHLFDGIVLEGAADSTYHSYYSIGSRLSSAAEDESASQDCQPERAVSHKMCMI